ncbi:unnamed protein product [Mytilus coruscus]|uniref:Temptin Cys/Cys disulfide domain-containing protein n=1 Tax=Mytilus coruscus TaxID=42192 RepID=A0A6J8EWT7_MYTCO|nr:unnamed protein product [Mytilus coruscus]
MDSENDGLSNGEELGDPDCMWNPRHQPKRTENISLPAKTPIQPQIQANEATQENPNPTLPSSTRTRNPSGKHKVGINNKWLKQYSWLYFDKDFSEDGTLVDVMLCKICNKHQSHGSNDSQTWSTVGYKLLSKDKIQIHQDSEQHKYAITLDMAHTVDDMASNISTGAQKAVKDALKVLFFILCHHLPLDLFGSTVDLCIDVGATDLSKLRLAKNATYSSWDTVHELLEILSSKVQLLLYDMKASPCYATMVDALYKYYKYSCCNTDRHKEIQKAFDQAPLAIKLAKHHRWLSHDQAISSIARSYRSLVVHLESAEIRNDPVRHGLLKNLKDPAMLKAVLLLADVLPNICSLSLVFQKRDVHLGNIKTSVEKTVNLLTTKKTQNGPWLQKEEHLRSTCNITDPPPVDFDTKVRECFLNGLIENITVRFKDADTIDQLAILDLTGTDNIETMYETDKSNLRNDKNDGEIPSRTPKFAVNGEFINNEKIDAPFYHDSIGHGDDIKRSLAGSGRSGLKQTTYRIENVIKALNDVTSAILIIIHVRINNIKVKEESSEDIFPRYVEMVNKAVADKGEVMENVYSNSIRLSIYQGTGVLAGNLRKTMFPHRQSEIKREIQTGYTQDSTNYRGRTNYNNNHRYRRTGYNKSHQYKSADTRRSLYYNNWYTHDTSRELSH